MSEVNQGHSSWRHQAIYANVHKACPNCGAPGVWSSDRHVELGWPGCYVEPTDPRALLDDRGVGNKCPNCSAPRDPSLKEWLGAIWDKWF